MITNDQVTVTSVISGPSCPFGERRSIRGSGLMILSNAARTPFGAVSYRRTLNLALLDGVNHIRPSAPGRKAPAMSGTPDSRVRNTSRCRWFTVSPTSDLRYEDPTPPTSVRQRSGILHPSRHANAVQFSQFHDESLNTGTRHAGAPVFAFDADVEPKREFLEPTLLIPGESVYGGCRRAWPGGLNLQPLTERSVRLPG